MDKRICVTFSPTHNLLLHKRAFKREREKTKHHNDDDDVIVRW